MDINADLGEGAGNDAQIMPFISSCNIACGGHYGDEASIRQTLRLAAKNQLKVGAHWSFPDRENFGRKILNLPTEELAVSLGDQLTTFEHLCRQEGVKLHHIKAHGALYNHGAQEEKYVDVMLELMKKLAVPPTLFLQGNTLLHQRAKGIFPIKKEAFIDRRYADASTLVSRNSPKALISDPKEAWEQFYNIYKNNFVVDVHGNKHGLSADTFCIHGDHSNSVEILHYFHRQFNEIGISLK